MCKGGALTAALRRAAERERAQHGDAAAGGAGRGGGHRRGERDGTTCGADVGDEEGSSAALSAGWASHDSIGQRRCHTEAGSRSICSVPFPSGAFHGRTCGGQASGRQRAMWLPGRSYGSLGRACRALRHAATFNLLDGGAISAVWMNGDSVSVGVPGESREMARLGEPARSDRGQALTRLQSAGTRCTSTAAHSHLALARLGCSTPRPAQHRCSPMTEQSEMACGDIDGMSGQPRLRTAGVTVTSMRAMMFRRDALPPRQARAAREIGTTWSPPRVS